MKPLSFSTSTMLWYGSLGSLSFPTLITLPAAEASATTSDTPPGQGTLSFGAKSSAYLTPFDSPSECGPPVKYPSLGCMGNVKNSPILLPSTSVALDVGVGCGVWVSRGVGAGAEGAQAARSIEVRVAESPLSFL